MTYPFIIMENEKNEGVEESKEESKDTDLKAEVGKLKRINTKLQKQLDEKKEEKEKTTDSKTDKQPDPKKAEPNGPNYGELAFLEQKGVNHPDDQKIVKEEAERLKLPLTDILGMEHIQSKLKDSKTQRDAEEGAPQGGGSGSGSDVKGSVDYWVNKTDDDGNFVNPTDPELHEKVVEARISKDPTNKMFDEDLGV